MTELKEDKLKEFVKKTVKEGDREKIEALWSLTLSECYTGIAKYRESFKKGFLEHFGKYLNQKYGKSDTTKIAIKIGKFLQRLSYETGFLIQKSYDPSSLVGDELKKLRKFLLGEKVAKEILIKALEDGLLSLKSGERDYIKYWVVGKEEGFDARDVRTAAVETIGEIPDQEAEKRLKFKSGALVLQIYLTSNGVVSSEDGTFDFLALCMKEKHMKIGEWEKIRKSILEKRIDREGLEEREKLEKRKEEAGWGHEEIIERVRRKTEIENYVEGLIPRKEPSKVDILWTIALAPTEVSRGQREEWEKNGMGDWLAKLSQRNLKLRHNREDGEEIFREVLEEIDDRTNRTFLDHEHYKEDLNTLRTSLEQKTRDYLKLIVESRWKKLSEKSKKIIQVTVIYLGEGKEGILRLSGPQGIKEYENFYDMAFDDLTKLTLFMNNEFNYGLEKKEFESTSSPGFGSLGAQRYESITWYTFDLADELVKSGVGVYTPSLTGHGTAREVYKASLDVGIPPQMHPILRELELDLEDTGLMNKIRGLRSKSINDLLEERDIMKRVDDIEAGGKFEDFIAKLLVLNGFKNVTRTPRDAGLDIVCDKNGKQIGVQVKKLSGSVGPNKVRELLGSREHPDFGKMDELIFVTNARFSRRGKERERFTPILQLWDREKLRKEVKKYKSKLF